IRRDGRSLAEIARAELGPLPGAITGIAILFIVTIAMAAMGVGVVNALREGAWGVFTIGCYISIAFGLGLYLPQIRLCRWTEGTAICVVLLLVAVVLGKPFADSSAAHLLVWAPRALIVAIAIYGFLASVLPVWLLLCPRDYLSSWLKIGTIALLIAGIF